MGGAQAADPRRRWFVPVSLTHRAIVKLTKRTPPRDERDAGRSAEDYRRRRSARPHLCASHRRRLPAATAAADRIREPIQLGFQSLDSAKELIE